MPHANTRKATVAVSSEYEEMRRKNIEDNQAILAKLKQEMAALPALPVIGVVRVKKEKTTSTKKRLSLPTRRNPQREGRHPRYNPLSPGSQRVTRSRASCGSVSSDGSSTQSSPPDKERFTMRVGLFGRRASDDEDSLDGFIDEDKPFRKPARRSVVLRENIPTPEDITETELNMVAQKSGGKTYDQAYGTTCHQCRQKTIDMKTICRNKLCHGVRGFFCGPCLHNRYGEDAKVALKDPDWICPPCRGTCNCSICRNRSGKAATGILIHIAEEYGYTNVNDYLMSFRK